MTPIHFPEVNATYAPPPDLEESQCHTIFAFHGLVESGSVDGAKIVVVAWKPSAEEIQEMANGSPIFLSCIGGLPAHFLSTDFYAATHPS